MRAKWRVATALLFSFLAVSPAAGAGFGIFTQGASGLGQANSVVAHGDGPSIVYFNPALMTRLQGSGAEAGTTLVFPDRDFHDGSGTTDGERDVYTPSTFYLVHKIDEHWSIGFGLFNPFGLGTDWPDDWEGRYIATSSEITTWNFNPTVAWQIHPRVSIAAGIDYLRLDARLEKKINSTAAGAILAALGAIPSAGDLPDSNQKFTGDGDGWGYNFGLAVDVGDHLRFGAAYRSEIEVEIEGEVSFRLASPLLSGAFPDTGGKTDIRLPQQAVAGLAWQPIKKLTIEAGVRWEDWSAFDRVAIRFDRPVFGETVSVQPRSWRDTFTYMVGAEYMASDRLALLAGYLYGESPIPDRTFEPAIPDSDHHLLSLGTEWRLERLRLGLAYAYQLQEKHRKNNDVGDPLGSVAAGTSVGTANGRYRGEMHLVALSASWFY